MALPLLSVISTVCNQGNWVRETVPRMRESLNGWPHEMIIVDDQSIDGSCHGLPEDVRILRTETRHGVSASRRLAVRDSTGDVLLFTDPHCHYPETALADLVACAVEETAIVLPATTSLPISRKPRYGGFLDACDRGLKISHSRNHPAEWPALLGTIYAVNRKTYDKLGGWPELPGVWGYSEQALSLMAWFCGIPIHIATEYICNHQHYHPHDGKKFAYRVPMSHQANNGHWIHAAFFPETYEERWAPVLKKRYRDRAEFWSCLSNRGWETKDPVAPGESGRRTIEQFRQEIQARATRTEHEFYRYVLKESTRRKKIRAGGGDDQEAYVQQQAKRSKPDKIKYESVTARQDRAIRWFIKNIPGCLKGRKILDLGSRIGYVVDWLDKMGVTAEGVELVPETAEYARKEMKRNVKTGDIRHLPYKDGQWHCTVCLHVLEHVPNPQVAVDEMLRVLMPGGWFLVAVPIEDTPVKRHAHNYAFPNEQSLLEMFENRSVGQIKTEVKSLKPNAKEILMIGRKQR